MNESTNPGNLSLPERLRGKLQDFRSRVWKRKLLEVGAAAVFGALLAYLCILGLDRLIDTEPILRATLLFLGALGFAFFLPRALMKWVFGIRKLERVAALVAKKDAHSGDSLLGIVELTQNPDEVARSPQLARAAVRQVDEDLDGRDLKPALPGSRHALFSLCAVLAIAVTTGLALWIPRAASNAFWRLVSPFGGHERYTFTALEAPPETLVVARGESFEVTVRLREDTESRPAKAEARYGEQGALVAERSGDAYTFEIPPQLASADLVIEAGDDRETIHVTPVHRPEITELAVRVELPGYLERDAETRDARGGSLSVVKGAKVTSIARASRPLRAGLIDGVAAARVSGNEFQSAPRLFEENGKWTLAWQDEYGLSGRETFDLEVRVRADEAPLVSCLDLGAARVVLDSETLEFQVRATDDFGVKMIGLEWNGVADEVSNPNPAKGEFILTSCEPTEDEIEVPASFTPTRLGISPQPIQLRAFTVDYLPGRERVYSRPHTLYVLNAEEHAVWITSQMARWSEEALEVRDREQQLLATNKELRALPAEQLDDPKTRRRIEAQAAAERANGRRLDHLTDVGNDLIAQALRNPEFNVQTLEKWAEMLKVLEDIAQNRMPSVSELLVKASEAPQSSGKPSDKEPGPIAGVVRDTPSGKSDSQSAPEEGEKGETPVVPAVVDVESGNNEIPEKKGETPPSNSSPKLSLPQTTVMGGGKQDEEEPQECPPQESLDEAIAEQEDLLEEFEKVAKELKELLGNLEESTFVKRLKAASRAEVDLANAINETTLSAFGMSKKRTNDGVSTLHADYKGKQVETTEKVALIQEDLEAYLRRAERPGGQQVLEDMKDTRVVMKLKDVNMALDENHTGDAMVKAEFWADTLDRWAEELVGPG